MAISHELSSEIATALFAAKERSPRELNDLKEVVFRIHSTLEQLTRDAHVARVADVDHVNAAAVQSFAKTASKDS